MVWSRSATFKWALMPNSVSRICWSNPLITLMTMISTATPSATPMTEIKVMTETNVRLGRRYRSASSSSNGNRDMAAAKLNSPPASVNARAFPLARRTREGIELAKPAGRQAFSDMAATKEADSLDSKFYKPADAFFPAYSNLGLTFDDVTLATLYSEVLPRDTQLDTTLADGLHLNIPVISSDMDTVTESRMAIAMALNGGLGLIHYNMPERQQLSEVSRVKNHVHGLIQDPIKVAPDQLIGDVLKLIEERKFALQHVSRWWMTRANWSACSPATSSSRATPNARSPRR